MTPSGLPDGSPRPTPVAPGRWIEAAERMVSGSGSVRRSAARRLVDSAPAHGIDLSLMRATTDPAGRIRQVALPVVGSGRTVMLFISRPGPRATLGTEEHQDRERVAAVEAACQAARAAHGHGVVLAQALPDPSEPWAERTYRAAGWLCVGSLSYLHRPLRLEDDQPAAFPGGVEARALRGPGGADDMPALRDVLERSYVDSLDCPGLTGLRSIDDIIQSHQATGAFSPDRWWIAWEDGRALGCALFNHCPSQRSVELVYLGVVPEARGRRLGKALLTHGILGSRSLPADEVACAVDQRNAPAIALYRSVGFSEFASRTAFVRPLGGE